MVKPADFFRGTVGLNTKADQARLLVDPKTGIVELARANNISIDDSLRPGLRSGQARKQTGAFHSLYCDNGPCFVAQDRADDAAIMLVSSDYSLSGVRSGLAKGRRVSFKQDGPSTTWYVNGVQNGIIVDGIPDFWPDHSKNVRDEEDRAFYPAPIGTHIEIAHGRMWIFENNILWYSEPYDYGKFAKASAYIPMATNGRVVRGVDGGLWVSDEKALWFFAGTDPAEMQPSPRSVHPALEWSDCIEMVDANATFGFQFSPGKSLILCTTEGLCACGPAGEFEEIGSKKIIHPDSLTSGATLIRGGNVIHSMWC